LHGWHVFHAKLIEEMKATKAKNCARVKEKSALSAVRLPVISGEVGIQKQPVCEIAKLRTHSVTLDGAQLIPGGANPLVGLKGGLYDIKLEAEVRRVPIDVLVSVNRHSIEVSNC